MTPAKIQRLSRTLTLDAIMADVCREFNVTREELTGRSRVERLVWPRFTAFWLARRLTPCSLSEIGRQFGRGHTTVVHGCQAMEERFTWSAATMEVTQALETALRMKDPHFQKPVLTTDATD